MLLQKIANFLCVILLIYSVFFTYFVVTSKGDKFDPIMGSTDEIKYYLVWAFGNSWHSLKNNELISAWNIQHPKAIIKEDAGFRPTLSEVYDEYMVSSK